MTYLQFEVIGTQWKAGRDPVRCVSCEAWLDPGESCEHIEHTDAVVRPA